MITASLVLLEVVAPTSASLGFVAAQIPPMAEPAPLLCLPSASTSAPITPLRSNWSRSLPGNLPPFHPASASGALSCSVPPQVRHPSVPAELISGRLSSSPLQVVARRLGRLTFALRACCRSLLRGSLTQELRAAGSPPPTFAASSQVPSPSLPSHACRKLVHSAARPCPVKARFAGNPYSAAAPSAARSRSAWVPTLRRLRISPLAPLSPDVLCRLRFSGLLAAPALASGCSVPLRGTASAGSGRTPFVLTPPLRPAQAQARFGSASRQPARSLPPAAGVPQTPQPASVVRSLGRLPSGSIPATLHSGQPASAPPFLRFRRCPCDRRPQGLLLSAPGGLRFCRLPSSALCTREFCRSGLRRRQAQAPLASAKPSQAQDWHARCAAAVAPGSGLRFDLAGSISIASVTFVPKALPFRRSSSVPSDPLHWALPGALYCASLIRLRPSRFRRLHRNDLRLDCFPPTRPFFPFTPLHSAAPPCAGALQRPVSAWGAGASPLHSAPLRERTVTPYPFISLRTLSAPLPSVYLPGLRSVRFTSVRASAHVIRYDIYAMVATTLLFCMR